MLALVKEYIIDLWEVRKVKLNGEPCSTQPQSQSLAGDPRDGTVVGGQRRGKFGKFSHSGRVTGKLSKLIIHVKLARQAKKVTALSPSKRQKRN